MKNERRSYTYPEASAAIAEWVKRKGMTPTQFHAWLEVRGIYITRQYCSMIIFGKGAGPRFIDVFTKITGVRVVKGLVEQGKADHL